jgi:hypothetical protein
MQFSKEPTSQNFGDLPRGEIPEPLKFNRPYRKYSTFCSVARTTDGGLPCGRARHQIKVFIIIYYYRDHNPLQRHPRRH